MVHAQPIRGAATTAILAGKVVAQEKISAREGRFMARHLVITIQHYNFGDRNSHRRRANKWRHRRNLELNPLHETVRGKRVWGDDASYATHHHAEGASDGGHMHWQPRTIQYQRSERQQMSSPYVVTEQHRIWQAARCGIGTPKV